MLRGFALGSRVVVAAGLIMVAVFAGFIANHDATIQSLGLALAFGILVDAFVCAYGYCTDRYVVPGASLLGGYQNGLISVCQRFQLKAS